jgi:hypothetical protein
MSKNESAHFRGYRLILHGKWTTKATKNTKRAVFLGELGALGGELAFAVNMDV